MLIIHSDRGSHYLWPVWLTRFRAPRSCVRCRAKVVPYEGFFGRLKTELFYPKNWQDVSVDQFIGAVDAYIRWNNENRIKISSGSLSPVEYRESLGISVQRVQVFRHIPSIEFIEMLVALHNYYFCQALKTIEKGCVIGSSVSASANATLAHCK